MRQIVSVQGEIITRLSHSILFDKEGLKEPVWVELKDVVATFGEQEKGDAIINIYKDVAIEKGLHIEIEKGMT